MRTAVLLAGLLACGGRGEPTTATAQRDVRAGEQFSGSLSPRPTPGAVAVAEVDEDTIWDVDVARYAGEHGLDARTALAELIDLTLLAQEARRRGLADDPEVVEARQRERTRVLMQREFAPSFDGLEDVPEADLHMAWRQRDIYLYFNHELYHRVRYVRVPVKKKATPEEEEAARVLAEDLRAHLVAAAPRDKEELDKAIYEWRIQRPKQRLDIADYAASTGGETSPRFKALAFSISKPGEISAVGRTKWGWDILFMLEVIPKAEHTFAQATPELRQKLFDTSQKAAFLRWVDGLAAGHRIVRRDALLEAVTVDSATAPAPP